MHRRRAQIGLNGNAHVARGDAQNRGGSFEDESLQFLTCEERESILFLEQTIDSLEQELEDEDLSLESSLAAESCSTDTRRSSVPELFSSHKEQDIIDLVQAEPDLARPRGVSFDPITPDFRNMVVSPETHFELKPKCETAENFLSGYSISPPLSPSGPSEEADPSSHSVYQPAGSIPTPVIIAQKIAAYQGAGDPIIPSSILSSHRSSLDSAGGSSCSASVDHLVKEGPPMSAKPTRYPDNITIQVGSRDYGQVTNRASVNVLHRQAQVLANLTGTSSTLESLETKTERNIPTRSISFRDPAPDRSHMEALSKLGLTRGRAISRTNSHLVQVNPPSVSTTKALVSNVDNSYSKSRTAASSAVSFKSETSSRDLNIYSGKPSSARPTASSETNADSNFEHMDRCDQDNTVSPQLRTKCSLSGFSNSGGKTRVITPLSKARNDTTCNSYDSISSINLPPLSTTATKTEASLSAINSCGGKTKITSSTSTSIHNTTTLSSNIVTRSSRPTETMSSSLPATREAFSIYSSHGENSKAATTSEINVNIPTKTIRPASVGLNARSMSFSKEPRTSEITLQTRQSRTSSFHGMPVSSEPCWRSFSKPPAFRPQGITVQFSGRGATDESRREALRKLGLLRDTS